jgi:phosphopantothenoylcysteine decarboxylase/phosphopantothenate--cysteine ligase
MALEEKKILVGISGGIAAYKTQVLIRILTAAGANVRVVMTPAAEQFVTRTTLEALSGQRAYVDIFEPSDEFPVLHVGLADWVDLLLIAPATAHTIAKLAHGQADDLLAAVALSSRAPLFLAPAMEQNMLEHPAVVENLETLRKRGAETIDPGYGALASGKIGMGRMAEPEDIAAQVAGLWARRTDLKGCKLLVTAGPTVEDIDPVRFITNRSSGKMGYAIARQAANRGAEVWLVSGPTSLAAPRGVTLRPVRSAAQMLEESEELFPEMDMAIMAAAVADFRVRELSAQKLRRKGSSLSLDLVENPDIAAQLGRRKERQVLVGFAMETDGDVGRARNKMTEKNCDVMILNNVLEEGAGFGVDTNIVTIVEADGETCRLPKLDKLEVANRILDCAQTLLPPQAL